MSMKSQLGVLVGLVAIAGLAGCGKSEAPATATTPAPASETATAAAPGPATVENVKTLSATVEAIDVEHRLLSLRGESGRTATIEIPPEVRNLDQVKVGDKLSVKYHESL